MSLESPAWNVRGANLRTETMRSVSGSVPEREDFSESHGDELSDVGVRLSQVELLEIFRRESWESLQQHWVLSTISTQDRSCQTWIGSYTYIE